MIHRAKTGNAFCASVNFDALMRSPPLPARKPKAKLDVQTAQDSEGRAIVVLTTGEPVEARAWATVTVIDALYLTQVAGMAQGREKMFDE
jgi:hypothetical protein